MPEQLLTAVLEIKELLKLIAEPQLAQRDEKRRAALRQIVGKSGAKIKVILALDGSQTQAELLKKVKIDKGDLSKLIKALRAAELLKENDKPELAIEIPSNFFEAAEEKQ